MGESILRVPGGKLVLAMSKSVDHLEERVFVDPQFLWYDVNVSILDFLDEIPKDRWIRVRGEEFLVNMDELLITICEWLGFPHGEDELEAMKHPEHSPFACIGPVNARLGNDINFLNNPKIRPARVSNVELGAPLSWRPDKASLFEEVQELARGFGYS
jgi:hypothetical protein